MTMVKTKSTEGADTKPSSRAIGNNCLSGIKEISDRGRAVARCLFYKNNMFGGAVVQTVQNGGLSAKQIEKGRYMGNHMTGQHQFGEPLAYNDDGNPELAIPFLEWASVTTGRAVAKFLMKEYVKGTV